LVQNTTDKIKYTYDNNVSRREEGRNMMVVRYFQTLQTRQVVHHEQLPPQSNLLPIAHAMGYFNPPRSVIAIY
jgi:hypothetical protein